MSRNLAGLGPDDLRMWVDVMRRLLLGPRDLTDVPAAVFMAISGRGLVTCYPMRARLTPAGRIVLAAYDLGREDARQRG